MIGHDYSYHRRCQRQFYNRLWQRSIMGLVLGATGALGAVTILGMLGAL